MPHGQMLSALSPCLAEAPSHCALTGKEREGASSRMSLLIRALTHPGGPPFRTSSNRDYRWLRDHTTLKGLQGPSWEEAVGSGSS